MRRITKLLIAVPLALVVLVVGGTWVYINVIREDPEEEFSLDVEGAAADIELPGEWTIAAGSQAGYRVDEVLFGQTTQGVGRTDQVEGSFTMEELTVEEAAFTVDMASIASDDSRRDGQFRTRIMAVDQFPTATFTLTEPIVLDEVPGTGETVRFQATGDLTLRGTTREVTFDLEAAVDGAQIEVVGSETIVFDDFGIPNPSNQAASTGDEGELEVSLILTKA